MAEVRTVSTTGGEKGAKEARFSLIPPFVLKKLAEHYGRGALKYADHNWRKGYKWSLSIDALHRHLNAFEDGEDFDVCLGHEQDCAFIDKDGNVFEGVPGVSCYNHTGNHHLDGVNFHGFALRYFAEYFPEFDDRFKPDNKKDMAVLIVPATDPTEPSNGHWYSNTEISSAPSTCGFAGCINHRVEVEGLK
jgi:hypothetical protein